MRSNSSQLRPRAIAQNCDEMCGFKHAPIMGAWPAGLTALANLSKSGASTGSRVGRQHDDGDRRGGWAVARNVAHAHGGIAKLLGRPE